MPRKLLTNYAFTAGIILGLLWLSGAASHSVSPAYAARGVARLDATPPATVRQAVGPVVTPLVIGAAQSDAPRDAYAPLSAAPRAAAAAADAASKLESLAGIGAPPTAAVKLRATAVPVYVSQRADSLAVRQAAVIVLKSAAAPALTVASQAAARLVPAAAGKGAAAAPAQTAGSSSVNGIPLSSIVVTGDGVAARVREIAIKGRALGRNPNAFSKVGDSTMAWPPLLSDFASPARYNLGPYANLQATIDAMPGSWARTSAAVKKGMHTWSEFDPAWVAISGCNGSEGPLACELRLNNPSIAIIRLGANDTWAPTEYEQNLREILDYCIERGVIPIVGTKPDRLEGAQNTINNLTHQIAAEYQIPLWDYDLLVSTVPGKGLGPDKVHFVMGDTHDFRSPKAFSQGQPLEDLSALMAIDAVRLVVASAN